MNPVIDLATDTEEARTSSKAWIVMGSLATAFMAVTCYGGWWYQHMIRHKFIEAVKGMWIPGSFLSTSGSGPFGRAVTRPESRDSIMDPLLTGLASPMWSDDGFSLHKSRNSDLGRHSYARDSFSGPAGMASSIHGPSITVSHNDGGDDIGLLAFDHIRDAPDREPTAGTQEAQL
ncbi:hypothetical protein NA56DRAFT_175684 [Hyaloscypha hepaticicola]|uniref:Uncharacterized protein n=1 Tax=Hyaloscypha hepaticicola TaxID=2082293 RepID=A0A2J6Q1U7_9HELO|nr:hypothetical protein NA56DRAFT_175684 [Hyaloscypha hepaticicola]